MPASEIDDIFASKGKAKAVPLAGSSSSKPTDSKKKKKKGKKEQQKAVGKRKREDEEPDVEKGARTTKLKVPETVIDPSAHLAVPSKGKSKGDAASTARPLPSKKPRPDKEDEERFKDSRGSGPRRTTEEGFSIYKEDELGITDQGGDTPLCPFDCQCCF
ncbi:unnamed protein product [Somion occarium]|uniref:DUF1764-domain-containing protein n=1 Tax=Somion occarium TaxID=3059160 RepID=A0ABP1CNB1_9APHY